MLGFKGRAQAVAAYKGNYQKGWKVGPITEMTVSDFKQWLNNGDTTKPVDATVKPVSSQAKPEQAIEDFGEKIGGARKDAWNGFKDDLNKISDDQIASQCYLRYGPRPNTAR